MKKKRKKNWVKGIRTKWNIWRAASHAAGDHPHAIALFLLLLLPFLSFLFSFNNSPIPSPYLSPTAHFFFTPRLTKPKRKRHTMDSRCLDPRFALITQHPPQYIRKNLFLPFFGIVSQHFLDIDLLDIIIESAGSALHASADCYGCV